MVRNVSELGRTCISGRNSVLADVTKQEARELYRKNWDGCRDRWKEYYRWGKLLRIIDRPIVPPDPKIVEYNLQRDENRTSVRQTCLTIYSGGIGSREHLPGIRRFSMQRQQPRHEQNTDYHHQQRKRDANLDKIAKAVLAWA